MIMVRGEEKGNQPFSIKRLGSRDKYNQQNEHETKFYKKKCRNAPHSDKNMQNIFGKQIPNNVITCAARVREKKQIGQPCRKQFNLRNAKTFTAFITKR